MSDPELTNVRRDQPFMATHKGERKKFWKVEHFNIGVGWICGVVGVGCNASSHELTDIEPLDEVISQLEYLQSLPGMSHIKAASR